MLSPDILKVLDKIIGRFICFQLILFKALRRKRKLENFNSIKRILVIRLWGIGDSVLMLPLLKVLTDFFPSSSIYMLVTERNYEVFMGFKGISRIIKVNVNSLSKMFADFVKVIALTRINFDVVLNAEPFLFSSVALCLLSNSKLTIGFNTESKVRILSHDVSVSFDSNDHATKRFLSLLNPLGIFCSTDRLEKIVYSSEDDKYVESFLKNEGILNEDLKIGIYLGPFLRACTRRWPLDKASELCDRLIEEGFKLIIVGAKNELPFIHIFLKRMTHHPIVAAGKTTLKQLAALIEKLDLFISPDAGPLHIASAMQTPTIALFGPGDPKVYGPLGEQNKILYKGLLCSPCIDAFKGLIKNCKKNRCMDFSVEEVLSAVKFTIKKLKRTQHK